MKIILVQERFAAPWKIHAYPKGGVSSNFRTRNVQRRAEDRNHQAAWNHRVRIITKREGESLEKRFVKSEYSLIKPYLIRQAKNGIKLRLTADTVLFEDDISEKTISWNMSFRKLTVFAVMMQAELVSKHLFFLNG